MDILYVIGSRSELQEIQKSSPLWRHSLARHEYQLLSGGQLTEWLSSLSCPSHSPWPRAPRNSIFLRCDSTFAALARLREPSWRQNHPQNYPIGPQLEYQAEQSSWDWAMACYQTNGRGQYGRQWQSPLGNLCVSSTLPQLPTVPARVSISENLAGATLSQYSTLLPMLLAKEVVRELCANGYPVWLKWPNDIVLWADSNANGPGLWGKAGGLLLENKRGVLTFGLGLNFAPKTDLQVHPISANELPTIPAASLRDSPGMTSDLLEFWLACVSRLQLAWARWLDYPHVDNLVAEIEPHLAFRNDWVEWFGFEHAGAGQNTHRQVPAQRALGILRGLGSRGELLLETSGGLQHKIKGSLRPLQK